MHIRQTSRHSNKMEDLEPNMDLELDDFNQSPDRKEAHYTISVTHRDDDVPIYMFPSSNKYSLKQDVLTKFKKCLLIFKRHRYMCSLLAIGIALIWIFVFATFLPKNSTGTVIPPVASPNKSSRKSFDMKDVFGPDFTISHKSFNFIRAPPNLHRQEEDPGLYYTVAQNSDHTTEIIVENLYDSNFALNLGPTHFEYNNVIYGIQEIEVSFHLDKMILTTNISTLFRHSKTALFWIKDISSNTITPLSMELLRSAMFSPSFNYVSYVDSDYNVMIYPLNGPTPVTPIVITNDGQKNSVLNGVTDWVYEEEVLGTDSTVWWSPNDENVAFLKLMERDVETYQIPLYTGAEKWIEFNYPTVGGVLPEFELSVVSLLTGKVHVIDVYQKEEELIYGVHWVDHGHIIVEKSDRHSTVLKTIMYSFNENKFQWERLLINELDYYHAFNGWVEKLPPMINVPLYEEGNDVRADIGFAHISPDSNGFNHIFYTPSVSKPSFFSQLTDGEYEVQEIVGYNSDSGDLYFVANLKHPMARHLYSISISKPGEENIVDLQAENDDLEYNAFYMSATARWSLREILGPSSPVTWVGPTERVLTDMQLEGLDLDRHCLTNDSVYRQSVDEKYNMPQVNYKSIMVESHVGGSEYKTDNTKELQIHYIEHLPHDFQENSAEKHPILVHVYGGPGSISFTTQSDLFFESAVCSSLNAIVLEIEPRGTGGKGWDFKQYAKNNIGYWEPRDIQRVVEKYIGMNPNKVDQDRIALWGWSYGGFTTLKTLEYDEGKTFKYGMAVAPVTDWELYDAVYSERYLGAPGSSYTNAIISKIENFNKTKRFLLMGGTADDNVHPINTFKFLDELNLHEVNNFDMLMFPDSDHNILHHNANKMVYYKLFSWLENAFGGKFDLMNV